ncbi:TolC family protein [Marinigracilibium pacificum]|uniref:TolC family protein n=1 Tax=Marinigracilibium pacificum TaxID=2729599 RepID=A0A848IWU5_9BACT|nr:TolC family protein [Marinigracilibium pacificum]NMM49003.1 TolC family protein [Marinigracilibium pacificum]
MQRLVKLLLLLVCAFQINGQDSLALVDVIKLIDNHPEAGRIWLSVKEAEAELQAKRGSFDPKLYGKFDTKKFNGSDYYTHREGGISIPTAAAGLDFKAGFEQNEGYYLNPELTVPDEGLWKAGLSFDLGRGLFRDEERTDLKNASLKVDKANAEANININELIFSAASAYFEWQAAYEYLQLQQELISIGTQRFSGVKRSAELGDYAAVDTLEALTQLTQRQTDLLEAKLMFELLSQRLDLYLWQDSLEVAQNIAANKKPEEKLIEPIVNGMVDSLAYDHPISRYYQSEIAILENTTSLMRQRLLPEIKLEGYYLFSDFENESLNKTNAIDENFYAGINVNFPILLRKERGSLNIQKARLEMTSLQWRYKQNEWLTKQRLAFTQWENLIKQLETVRKNAEYFRLMMEAERRLFEAGESTLFLVFSRENKYMEAQIKLINMTRKTQESYLKWLNTSGMLIEWKEQLTNQ